MLGIKKIHTSQLNIRVNPQTCLWPQIPLWLQSVGGVPCLLLSVQEPYTMKLWRMVFRSFPPIYFMIARARADVLVGRHTGPDREVFLIHSEWGGLLLDRHRPTSCCPGTSFKHTGLHRHRLRFQIRVGQKVVDVLVNSDRRVIHEPPALITQW